MRLLKLVSSRKRSLACRGLSTTPLMELMRFSFKTIAINPRFRCSPLRFTPWRGNPLVSWQFVSLTVNGYTYNISKCKTDWMRPDFTMISILFPASAGSPRSDHVLSVCVWPASNLHKLFGVCIRKRANKFPIAVNIPCRGWNYQDKLRFIIIITNVINLFAIISKELYLLYYFINNNLNWRRPFFHLTKTVSVNFELH